MQIAEARTQPIIEARNVFADYLINGNTVKTLNSINLSVHRGELVFITGEKGSGKHKIMNILSGTEKPASGNVFIGGVDLYSLSRSELFSFRRQRFGLLLQKYDLIANLTVFENIALPLQFQGIDRKECKSKVLSMLDDIGLSHKANSFPTAISRRDKSKIMTARAFITKPDIVFADIPEDDLEESVAEGLISLINFLAEKYHQTVILASEKAPSFHSGRIFMMEYGNISEICPIAL